MVRGNRVPPAPSVAGPTLEFGSCSPAHVAQAVEHFLGKEKVPGSNPGVGSTTLPRLDFVFISSLLEGVRRPSGNDRETDWNLPK
jgi:hypothetical protein